MTLDARRDRIGPGHFVLVVGPSGAGKDSVLTLARAATRHDERIVFPRRVITRAATGAEDHDTVSDAQFDLAVADGAFALWWSAHGHKYGIPIAAKRALRAGRTVICNVSRSVVALVRDRYSAVSVVLITAPTDVLQQRLAARGRDSDGNLSKRIARNEAPDARVAPDVTIMNVDAPEIAAEKLLDVIRLHGMAFAI